MTSGAAPSPAHALTPAQYDDVYRPRTVGELLDGAFYVNRKHFWTLLLACTLVSVPTLLGAALYAEPAAEAMKNYLEFAHENAQRAGARGFDADKYVQQAIDQVVKLSSVATFGAILQAVSRGGAIAVVALATWHLALGRSMPSAWALTRRALPRLPAVIGMYFVLWQLIGCVALCPPLGIAFLAAVSPVPVVMMLERGVLEQRAVAARERSSGVAALLFRFLIGPCAVAFDGLIRSLTLTFHGPTIGRGTLFVGFLWLFLSFFVLGVTGVVQLALDATGTTSWAPFFWAQHYAEVVMLPALGVGSTLWYLDLRVRREGLGLTVEPQEPPA